MNAFEGFPKIARLNREIIITEKIDGTNAQVYIRHARFGGEVDRAADVQVQHDGSPYYVRAGSRNRYLSVEKDNFGFAAWVHAHAEQLAAILGEGRHFGEWWGKGIQRGYGLDHKRFSLFNTSRWDWLKDAEARTARDVPFALDVVPVLYQGPRIDMGCGPQGGDWQLYDAAQTHLEFLQKMGSAAAPGFMDPEGIVVFHTAANTLFKATCKNDEQPKGKVAA